MTLHNPFQYTLVEIQQLIKECYNRATKQHGVPPHAHGHNVIPACVAATGLKPVCPTEASATLQLAQPSSKLNYRLIQHELSDHPNRPLVDAVLHQLKWGFDILVRDVPTSFYQVRLQLSGDNWGSASKFETETHSAFEKNLAMGYTALLPRDCPAVLAPLGVRAKKHSDSMRLISDHSHAGVNGLIPAEATATKLPSISDVVNIMRLGIPDLAGTTLDIEAAYQSLAVEPHARHLLGMHLAGRTVVAMSLPFGLASSPICFENYASLMTYILDKRVQADSEGEFAILFRYVDDFFLICRRHLLAKLTHTTTEAMGQLGIAEAKHKRQSGIRIPWIGVMFDFEANTISVPPDRQAEILQMLDMATLGRAISEPIAGALLGKLAFYLAAAPAARCFTRRLSAAYHRAAKRAVISIDDSTLEDILILRKVVSENPGRCAIVNAAHTLVSDASGIDGAGGYFFSFNTDDIFAVSFAFDGSVRTGHAKLHDQAEPSGDPPASSTLLEAAALLGTLASAVDTLGWAQSPVHVVSDNFSLVMAIEKGRSPTPAINHLIRLIALLCLNHSLTLLPLHLPRTHALINAADALSHFKISTLQQTIMPSARLHVAQVHPHWPPTHASAERWLNNN